MDEAAVGPVDAGLDERTPTGEAGDRIADRAFLDALAGDLPRIQRTARLMFGDPDAADDAVAEAVARSLPRWRAGTVDDPAAYLRTVVVNLAARRWRRRALARRRDHAAAAWAATPADTASVAAERDRTLRAVGRLPARRRAVVVLRFYDDLSEQEIATVLGVRIGTVKSQLSRALGQLRRDLGTPEET